MISVVIRTKNEAEHIGECIKKVRIQKIQDEVEIIVIDSGSTDETLNIVKRHNVELYEIRPEEFTYSYALNLGFGHSKGKFVCALSAHAIPISENWLSVLLNNFEDNKVAGVTSKEVPWKRANLYEKYRLESAFNNERKVFTNNKEKDLIFSNAASCIRKSVWQRFPFEESLYAEDYYWAKKVLNKGYKIVYEPEAVVNHSHNDSPRIQAHRYLKSYFTHRIYNEKGTGFIAMGKAALKSMVTDLMNTNKKIKTVADRLELTSYIVLKFCYSIFDYKKIKKELVKIYE